MVLFINIINITHNIHVYTSTTFLPVNFDKRWENQGLLVVIDKKI